LPEEMAAIQRVARIITTTLDIDQVYERFAAEVKKLVDFDRMVINVVIHDAGTFSPTYQAGTHWDARKPGAVIPLDKTLTGMIVKTGRSYRREDIAQGDSFPGDSGRLSSGLRSALLVPLRNKGQITAVLHILSRRVGEYGDREQAILERLADQIASAVENAELYRHLQTSTDEKAVVHEVARIITSTLDIEQVYERFAAEAKKLVDFDRMTISFINPDAGTFSVKLLSGVQLQGREAGAVVPIEGNVFERVLRTGRPHLREDIRAGEGFALDAARLRAGLRSSLAVPLFDKGRTMGTLTVHSNRVCAYGPREQAILERLADQIAPAVENSRLYDRLQASAEEKAVVDEVARIITSTLDIGQVYEKFAAEMKKLVDFDRVAISVIDHDGATFTPAYMSGVPWEGREVGAVVPLEGSLIERVLLTGWTLLREDLGAGDSFSGDAARLKAGLRTSISVPLFSKDRIGGTLHLLSRRVGTYGPHEQAILERMADQIAPAVENAWLYDQLQTGTEEKAVVDEIARIITSTLDIDQVYERFADEVKKLVDFDRINLSLINRDAGTYTIKYLHGLAQPGRRAGDVVALQGTQTEQVMVSGEALITKYVADGTRYPADPALLKLGLSSRILLPLISKGTVIGTLALHSRRTSAYGAREKTVLRRLVDQIAPAVENAQIYHDLGGRLKELDCLYWISTTSQEQEISLEELLQRACEFLPSGWQYPEISCSRIVLDTRKFKTENFNETVWLQAAEIVAGGDRRGSVEVYYLEERPRRYEGPFLREERKLIDAVAQQLGQTIERRQVSHALQESEARYKDLYEEAPIAYLSVDPKGRVLRANRKAAELFGYPEDRLTGLSAFDLYADTPAGQDKAREMFERFVSGKEIRSEAVEYRRPDGRHFWGSLSVQPIVDAGGKVIASRSTVEDITERKSLQEQLVRSQKMEVFGQLAGGVAHDFNNLLTPLLGFSEMAAEALAAGEPMADYIDQVRDAAKRASRLTQQLLAFSRRQTIEPTFVNLNDLVANTERMLRRLIGEDIELELRPAPDLGIVKVDTGQMEQVLVNLFVNARDAMPRGGKLTIETANVALDPGSAPELAPLTAGEYVKLSVSDTGVGMDEVVKAHLFEPFFTTKEPGKGTGLGLATCDGILKENGGGIRVRSEPGLGAIFDILLPRVEGVVAPVAEDRRSRKPPGGAETVLLVEDEPAVRFLAAEVLRRQGYTVLEAANGEEALRVGHEHGGDEIALLLTDVVMPQMGGRELADCLEPLLPRMKVLFTSGFLEESNLQDEAIAPGISFMPKPFTPTELTRKVRAVLDRP
jgi:PAS domain S-box-containing protein